MNIPYAMNPLSAMIDLEYLAETTTVMLCMTDQQASKWKTRIPSFQIYSKQELRQR